MQLLVSLWVWQDGYILYEVFAGEAAQANASSNSKAQQSAYNANGCVNRLVYLSNRLFLDISAGGTDENALNAIYNLADIINKIAFGLVIWAAAKSESAAKA